MLNMLALLQQGMMTGEGQGSALSDGRFLALV